MTLALQRNDAAQFNDEEVQLLKRVVATGLSDSEFKVFLAVCERKGLDPFQRQIYAVKRGGKMVIQTGIDGLRAIAARTGVYAGNDDPVFDNEESPAKATVTVYKIVGGQRCAFTASARWDQYFPGERSGHMWLKMPHVMLGKCAESLALRKAFPEDLSGLYTTEEMQQADHKGAPSIQAQVVRETVRSDEDELEDGFKRNMHADPPSQPELTSIADVKNKFLATHVGSGRRFKTKSLAKAFVEGLTGIATEEMGFEHWDEVEKALAEEKPSN